MQTQKQNYDKNNKKLLCFVDFFLYYQGRIVFLLC